MSNWKYEGESEDFKSYRKYDTDKVKASDSKVRNILETLHEWFPNQSLNQLKDKEDIIQKNFLIKYPNADMSKFDVISNSGDGTNVFFGAWAIFGDSPDDERF